MLLEPGTSMSMAACQQALLKICYHRKAGKVMTICTTIYTHAEHENFACYTLVVILDAKLGFHWFMSVSLRQGLLRSINGLTEGFATLMCNYVKIP